MKIRISTFVVMGFAIVFAGCNQYDKTKDGLLYKITKGTGSQKVKQGDLIKFNVEFRIKEKDTVLNSTYGHVPVYMRVDTAQVPKYDFRGLLTKCTVGDKVDFVINIDSLKKMGMIMEYNNIFKKGGVINGKMEILKTFTNEQEIQADVNKEVEAEKQREISDLEKYAKSKNITTQKTASGILVEVTTAGDAAAKVDSGKQVSIIYKGYVASGKVFDSTAKGGQPYTFVIGTHQVIPGWDEGLRMFGKGGKGRLLVPAMSAYGAQGSMPVIPPYTNLIFDVEVADVTVPAPTPAAQPGAPTQPVNPNGK